MRSLVVVLDRKELRRADTAASSESPDRHAGRTPSPKPPSSRRAVHTSAAEEMIAAANDACHMSEAVFDGRRSQSAQNGIADDWLPISDAKRTSK